MKAFKIPAMQVIRFEQGNIVSTSVCRCVNCTVCPEGKDNCFCVDFCTTNYSGSDE